MNKKGFTLIELLAIIVILAIIMVVTIPTVLTSMDSAKTSQLENATASVAEWFEKQYTLATMGTVGDAGANNAYTTFVGTNSAIENKSNPKKFSENGGEAALIAAGVADAGENFDLTKSTVYFDTAKGRVCVTLVAKSGGSFYVSNTADNTRTSAGC